MDFIILFLIALIVVVVIVLLATWAFAYILRLPIFSQRTRNMSARGGLMVVNRFMRAEINVIGQENLPAGNFVIVGNHVSNIDILALCEAIPRPIAFVAKEELGKVPFLGSWMETMKCVFIKRDDVRGSIKLINEVAAQQVKDGLPMVIFPEGTRSGGHEVAPFKGGSFSLVTNSQAPVVPVTIENTHLVTKKFPKKTQIYVTIHPAISPETYKQMNRNQLATRVYEEVLSGFHHENA